MTWFRSEARTVSDFEKHLTLTSLEMGYVLPEAELLQIRSQFIIFLRDKLQSFSFSGLQWWALCFPQCKPIVYQKKLLMIIKRGNIAHAELTLRFILNILTKIFKTTGREDIEKTTLWVILNELLNEPIVFDERHIMETMLVDHINYLVIHLDNGLDNEANTLQVKCSYEILNRVYSHYAKLKKMSSWGKLKFYKEDIEVSGEPQNEVDAPSFDDSISYATEFRRHRPTGFTLLQDASNNLLNSSYNTLKEANNIVFDVSNNELSHKNKYK